MTGCHYNVDRLSLLQKKGNVRNTFCDFDRREMELCRFLRLPKEKIEAIRIAAVKEFMRVPLEEASINRIVHDADISRGSFYTYFEDKQDLLRWLIYAQAEQHFKNYIERLQENGGDLWDMLENVFDRGMDLMERAGLIEIFQNLIKSAKFMEIFRGDPESDPQVCRENQRFMKLLYENIDQDKAPISREALNELIEMHMVVFIMSIKRFFRDGEAREEASEYYKRHIHMLHYGICAYRSDSREEEQR